MIHIIMDIDIRIIDIMIIHIIHILDTILIQNHDMIPMDIIQVQVHEEVNLNHDHLLQHIRVELKLEHIPIIRIAKQEPRLQVVLHLLVHHKVHKE